MNNSENKRVRSKNFSVAEEHMLVDLVYGHQHILESKRSDAVTWKEKDEVWQTIAEKFAAQSGVNRTYKVLKDKFDNLKRKARMEAAENKRETYRTGGGVASNNKITPVSQKILEIIQVSATGLVNEVDDDAIIEIPSIIEEKDSDISMCGEYVLDLEGENIFVENVASSSKRKADVDSQASFTHWNPAKLRMKKSEKLSVSPKKNTEDDRRSLIKLQMQFYKEENIRGRSKREEESAINKANLEKINLEIEGIRLSNRLKELEIAEKELLLN